MTPKGIITEPNEDFKKWVGDNGERIAQATTLPYWHKDNKRYIKPALKSEPTTKEIAERRHAARTPEQVAAIKARWAERRKRIKLMQSTANNVLKVAKDYGEVDYSVLEALVASGNLDKMYAEAKTLAKEVLKVKKQEAALSDLIPDVHKWHKQVSMSELQTVHTAVKGKLAQLSSLSLEGQAKKLAFEAYDYLGGNMNNVQGKYPNTWKVSQAAYVKSLNSVQYEIDVQTAKSELATMLAYSKAHPKAKVFAGLVADADAAIAKGADIAIIKNKMAIADIAYQKRLAAEAKRAKKTITTTNAVKFDADAYTKDRKNSALWTTKKDSRGLYDRENGDAFFRKFAEKDWKKWSENEKDVAYNYTSGSSYINEPLYTTYYGRKIGFRGEIRDSWSDINTLTDMIDKSTPFTKDVWLNRGASKGEFLGEFGVRLDDYLKKQDSLNGAIGEQKAFMSTAHSKSWGFVDNGKDATCEVVYNIYCPKGTKGIYTEPFSRYGNGGRVWDGETKAPLANEVEVILQRGTRLRVIKAYHERNKWFVDMEVIEQPAKFPNQP